MLRTTVDVQAIKNRQKFPKNNNFAYKWRVLDNFSKSIDREQHYMNISGGSNDRSLMNDRILQLYKARYEGFRKDLMVDLVRDTMQFLQTRRVEHKRVSQVQVTLLKATQAMLDRCFNTLLSFATELNSILGLSELFITAMEPEVKKRSSASEASMPTKIQASLSTTLYRLVLEGRHEQLQFYIIPTDDFGAMNDIHLQYDAVETWQAKLFGTNQVAWLYSGGTLSDECIEVACVNLLRLLIETTQERLMPNATLESHRECQAMSAPDPWMQESSNRQDVSEFESKSGYGTALASLDDLFAPPSQPAQLNDWQPVYTTPLPPVLEPEVVCPPTEDSQWQAQSVSAAPAHIEAAELVSSSNFQWSEAADHCNRLPDAEQIQKQSRHLHEHMINMQEKIATEVEKKENKERQKSKKSVTNRRSTRKRPSQSSESRSH